MADETSYTSASSMPWKLLKCRDALHGKTILPYHLQLIPTNKCNGNCEWCSCQGVDRTLEFDWGELEKALNYFYIYGTKAITVTGGGEPTIYPRIMDLFEYCNGHEIEIGLVTNGLKWSKSIEETQLLRDTLTWMRVSVMDTIGNYNIEILENMAQRLPNIDMGISFTVSRDVNIPLAMAISEMAEKYENITHIRFVQDIFKSEDINVCWSMQRIKTLCSAITDKGIYQFRKDHTLGSKKCLISRLKPMLNCDGYIYPCCGVQYAGDELKTMPEEFRMCYWEDYKGYGIFDGSICKKCYYKDYNDVLERLVTTLEHGRFL